MGTKMVTCDVTCKLSNRRRPNILSPVVILIGAVNSANASLWIKSVVFKLQPTFGPDCHYNECPLILASLSLLLDLHATTHLLQPGLLTLLCCCMCQAAPQLQISQVVGGVLHIFFSYCENS